MPPWWAVALGEFKVGRLRCSVSINSCLCYDSPEEWLASLVEAGSCVNPGNGSLDPSAHPSWYIGTFASRFALKMIIGDLQRVQTLSSDQLVDYVALCISTKTTLHLHNSLPMSRFTSALRNLSKAAHEQKHDVFAQQLELQEKARGWVAKIAVQASNDSKVVDGRLLSGLLKSVELVDQGLMSEPTACSRVIKAKGIHITRILNQISASDYTLVHGVKQRISRISDLLGNIDDLKVLMAVQQQQFDQICERTTMDELIDIVFKRETAIGVVALHEPGYLMLTRSVPRSSLMGEPTCLSASVNEISDALDNIASSPSNWKAPGMVPSIPQVQIGLIEAPGLPFSQNVSSLLQVNALLGPSTFESVITPILEKLRPGMSQRLILRANRIKQRRRLLITAKQTALFVTRAFPSLSSAVHSGMAPWLLKLDSARLKFINPAVLLLGSLNHGAVSLCLAKMLRVNGVEIWITLRDN